MSDDEADPELLELLRQSLGRSNRPRDEISSDTGVLKDAEFIYNNAIDVSIDMYGTKAAAESIYSAMQERAYSTHTWAEHELHPTHAEGFSDIDILNFVFTVDLLNFSFWSSQSEAERFQVEYKDKRYTGYKSLLACLRRALDENIPVTTPRFWNDDRCSDELLRNVFRSATSEEMPLLSNRIDILRGAGQVLHTSFGDPDTAPANDDTFTVHDADRSNNHPPPAMGGSNVATSDDVHDAAPKDPDVKTEQGPESADADVQPSDEVPPVGSLVPPGEAQPLETQHANLFQEGEYHSKPDMTVARLVEKANHSAGRLVNLLVKYFPSFQDEARFDRRKVRLYKRAQIFVADLWAASNGTGYGEFGDIDHLTMFADYRVPQMLRSLGVLAYSPPLEYTIKDQKEIAPGHSWEVQLRGCSIWAVELIRREITRLHPETNNLNAVLIDFFLYDLAKEREEAAGKFFYNAILRLGTRVGTMRPTWTQFPSSLEVGENTAAPAWVGQSRAT